MTIQPVSANTPPSRVLWWWTCSNKFKARSGSVYTKVVGQLPPCFFDELTNPKLGEEDPSIPSNLQPVTKLAFQVSESPVCFAEHLFLFVCVLYVCVCVFVCLCFLTPNKIFFFISWFCFLCLRFFLLLTLSLKGFSAFWFFKCQRKQTHQEL